MFKGEFVISVDRAYSQEEIKRILDVSDLRMKSIILLMASSGVRIGAIPLLNLRNIEKINSIYKITIYEAHFESEIKDSLETTNNPFESYESIFLSTVEKNGEERVNIKVD